MKQFLRKLLLVTLIAPASLVLAHSNHGKINNETAVQIAHKTVQQMTFKDAGYSVGKLNESWKSVKPDNIKVVEVGDGFYVLRITQNETKQSLSMKIASTGQVLEVAEEVDSK
tara:strand:- start:2312 stop:2650 length:339 start_codon:yes stop_codon:yes gene_type:complete